MVSGEVRWIESMKIGFPNNPRRNILTEVAWIGNNSFDFVDLFLEEDLATPEKIDTESLKDTLSHYSLEAVGHTAWYLPIGSPVKALRAAAIDEVERYLALFSRIGVSRVTVHSQWPGGMFSAQEGLAFQIESLREIVLLARELGIGIMYEPVDTPDDSLKNVARILDRIPELLFHLDIGHAHLHGRKPEQFIQEFSSRLSHVHLHDNSRNLDLHLPMGCGTVNWDDTVKALKKYYDGTITIEVFSRDKEYVLMSRDKLKRMWDAL
jgi:sugar phosphate isomerase/epimerase